MRLLVALFLLLATPALADTITLSVPGLAPYNATISAADWARILAAAKGLNMGGVGATDQQASDALARQVIDMMRTRALIYERSKTGQEPAALTVQ